MKTELPKGKITIRHRQMRGVFQCYAGRQYLTGAAGETADDAARELEEAYEVPKGTIATVHGYANQTTIQFNGQNKEL